MEVILEFIIFWIIIPIFELLIEATLAKPISKLIKRLKLDFLFFKETDNYFVFFLKVVLLACLVVAPVAFTIVLLNKIK
jgi:hypothetical protein